MADPQSTPDDEDEPHAAAKGAQAEAATDDSSDHVSEEPSTEDLRKEVEEQYDFDDFGPEDMADMSADEWEAAFDPDTWITGEELLDRAEADLKYRVVIRDVFARVERLDGRIIAYSDQGYATVHPDGSVEGFGTVLRDVKPVVALCSMDSYDVPDMPEGEVLPEPADVPEGSGELGNFVLQVIAGVQVLAGVGLLLAWLLFVVGVIQPPTTSITQNLNLTLMIVAGLAFLGIGLVLFLTVANARLSDRFRAEEYRNRLRAVGLEDGERPDFVPVEDDDVGDDPNRLDTGDGSQSPVESETEPDDAGAETERDRTESDEANEKSETAG